ALDFKSDGLTTLDFKSDDSTAFSNPVKYRQVVGSLQYVTLSRPDITFAVNKVCQYMHAPTENHWSAVKRILRYLHGTVEHGMLIRRSSGSTLQAFTDVLWKGNPDTSLEDFSDADWAGDSNDRRSTRGFAIYLEAEYKALADTVDELTWLQALLNELGIRSSSTHILWCDNLGATYLSTNPIFHARTKHVEIDYHFVREKVAQGYLRVQHISTHDQITDIFTKPLPTPRFLFLRSKLQIYSPLLKRQICSSSPPYSSHCVSGVARVETAYLVNVVRCCSCIEYQVLLKHVAAVAGVSHTAAMPLQLSKSR
ncbi:gag/pol polyprotein, partial [Tanacetum coccineum]